MGLLAAVSSCPVMVTLTDSLVIASSVSVALIHVLAHGGVDVTVWLVTLKNIVLSDVFHHLSCSIVVGDWDHMATLWNCDEGEKTFSSEVTSYLVGSTVLI